MKKLLIVLIIVSGLSLIGCQQQRGDVNNDGKATITDLIALRGHLEGKISEEGFAYDINKDGEIDELDFDELKNILLK